VTGSAAPGTDIDADPESTRPEVDALAQSADRSDALFPHPAPPPPHTGDALVDDALRRLNGELDADLAEHPQAGQRVLEVLQSRLQDAGAD